MEFIMKKNLILVGLLSWSVNSFANESENKLFVGLEVGSANLSVKLSAPGIESQSNSDRGGYTTLKVGKYIDVGRITGSYSMYNEEDDVDMNVLSLSYDYLFKNSSSFTPFIGANIGYFSYELSNVIDNSNLDIKGLTYGLGAGGLYAINDNFDFEINLRYNITSADDLVRVPGTSVDIKAEAESISHVGIGFNYNF
jgi:opacity protein-like surface antigen